MARPFYPLGVQSRQAAPAPIRMSTHEHRNARLMLFPGTWQLAARAVMRANKNRKEARARRVARLYARLRPKDPHAWLLWSSVEETYWAEEASREKVLRRGLAANPRSIELAVALAQCLVRQRREDEAEPILQRCRAEDAASMWPYIGLMEMSWWSGRFTVAKIYARQAEMRLRFDPEDLSDVWALTDQLIKLSELEWAASILRRMVDQKPISADPYILLSLLLEDVDESESAKLMSQARRRWTGKRKTLGQQTEDLREWLQECSEPLATFKSRSARPQ